MSTEYYPLRPSFSSIRVESNPRHTRITLWSKGANIGTLTILNEEKQAILPLFFDCDNPSVTLVGAGEGKVKRIGNAIKSDSYHLSEYGELAGSDALLSVPEGGRCDRFP